MSRIVFLFTILFALHSTAQAESLLQVKKASGFVFPENSYSLNCTIGSQVTVERIRLGSSNRIRTRIHPTRFTRAIGNAQQLRRSIARAAGGRLFSTPGPTDMPTSTYYGLLGSRRIKLFVDESIRRTRNLAPSVPGLLALANLNCPTPR